MIFFSLLSVSREIMLPCLRLIAARRASLCGLNLLYQRSFVITSTALQQQQVADPIQKLFVDKIREYALKSKSAELGLVDATVDVKKSLQDAMEKVERQFEAKGVDMTTFPTLQFADPKLVDPGLGGTGEFTAPPVVEVDEEETEDLKNLPWIG